MQRSQTRTEKYKEKRYLIGVENSGILMEKAVNKQSTKATCGGKHGKS